MSDLYKTANKDDFIRAMIARHKRWDIIFSMIGLAAMLLGVITLLALFLDLVLDGYGRLNYEFFTSFPSRHAGQAGILSAWVGTTLVMLVAAPAGVPRGGRA